MRVLLQPAYILHSRPYRETSVLLEVLSRDYGRLSLVARSVRRSLSLPRALLQLFTPLLLSWQGKTELMTLSAVEASGVSHFLKGPCLLSAFYLNELLVRLLHKQDPHPKVYTVYQTTLVELSAGRLPEFTLRLFEKTLLDELGYGLTLEHDFKSGEPIQAHCYYRFYPEHGFELCHDDFVCSNSAMVFSGRILLALASERLDDRAILQDVKRLMRMALAPLLGTHPLQSRKLFLEVEKNEQQ